MTLCAGGLKAFVLKGSFGFPSFCLEEKLKGSFCFPGSEEFLTLVADQGRRSPPLLFFFFIFITGAWGPARVYLFSILIL